MTIDAESRAVGRTWPALAVSEAHVWSANLDVAPDERRALASYLSADEWQRSGAYRFSRHRDAFVVARGMLRSLLGRYADRPPGSLHFETGAFGRPELVSPRHVLTFNVSHCDSRLLVVVARSGAVGVDLERIDAGIDVERLAADYLAAEEQAELRASPPPERPQHFVRCWTRKEAYLKALGVGLSRPLTDFAVVREGDRPGLHRVHPADTGALRMRVMDLTVGAGWAAAVACPAHYAAIRRWHMARADSNP